MTCQQIIKVHVCMAEFIELRNFTYLTIKNFSLGLVGMIMYVLFEIDEETETSRNLKGSRSGP